MRSIRKFLLRFCVYAFICYSLVIAISIAIDYGLRATNSLLWRSWNDISKGNINADILILGSSRAETQYHPKHLELKLHTSVFNLGLSGYDFNMQARRYDYYCSKNNKPGMIILNVDPFSFKKRKDLYNWEQFLPYLHDSIISNACQLYNGFNLADYTIPGYKYYGAKTATLIGLAETLGLKSLSTFPRNVYYYKGYHEQHENVMENVTLQGEKSAYFDEKTIRRLTQFLDHCSNENIKVNMVYAPISTDYLNILKNQKAIEIMFDSIANHYSATFINFNTDSTFSDAEHFYDPIHLNKKGSILFSKMLADSIYSNRIHE